MPRLAKIFTLVLWGILVVAAQAQYRPYNQTLGDSVPLRVPAPPPRISDGDEWIAPNSGEPQASVEEPADEKNGSPSPSPLPIPPPPQESDASVKPVSYQERVPPENPRPAEDDSTSAPDKSPAVNPEKTPLSLQNHKSKIPLTRSGKTGNANAGKPASGLPSMISVAGTTGLVLGIFLFLVWIVRRKTPQALVRLPGEAFEVLGRAPLNGRQQVQLLRCGNRLLLVSVTAGSAETLTEITDPVEVDRLSGLCRQSQPGSSSAAFKQVFEQLAPRRPFKNEISPHGYDESQMTAAYGRGGRRWEDRDA